MSEQEEDVTEIQEHASAASTRFEEAQLEADGFQIRYLTAGTGSPVVYFHGGGGLHVSSRSNCLAARFQVTAFEFPGFGHSPENTRTQSLDELAETMVEALDALGLENPTLLGTSLGAGTAVRLAVSHPNRVSAMILESPSAFRPADWSPQNFTPEQLRAALFAHADTAPAPEPPEIIQKQIGLVAAPSRPEPRPGPRGASSRLPDVDARRLRDERRTHPSRDGADLQAADAELQPRVRLRRCARDPVRPARSLCRRRR